MTSPADPVGALTVLVQSIRTSWDTRAIRPVLQRLVAEGHDLADIAWSAIRTAEDRSCLTPTAIGQTDRAHWRPTVRDRESTVERNARLQAQRDRAAEREREAFGPYRQAHAAVYSRGASAAREALAAAAQQRQHTEETR